MHSICIPSGCLTSTSRAQIVVCIVLCHCLRALETRSDRCAPGLYNAFLAPGSPCELNIDHTLRQDMASRMTRAVAKDDASMYTSLKEVATLFDRAQQQVFKLMAGVSCSVINCLHVTYQFRTRCRSSFAQPSTRKWPGTCWTTST